MTRRPWLVVVLLWLAACASEVRYEVPLPPPVVKIPKYTLVEIDRSQRRISDEELRVRIVRGMAKVERLLGPFEHPIHIELLPRIPMQPDIDPQGQCDSSGEVTIVRLAMQDLNHPWDEQRPRQSTVTHELAHARVHELRKDPVPMINEGVADFLSSGNGLNDADLAWVESIGLLSEELDYPQTNSAEQFVDGANRNYAGGWARVFYMVQGKGMSLRDVILTKREDLPTLGAARIYILGRRADGTLFKQ